MPLYIAKYIQDTQHLSTEEHGAYLLILMHAWTNGGKLPADPERLRVIAKMDSKPWRRSWSTLSEFLPLHGDCRRNKRIDQELHKARAMVEQRSEAGRASAEKRWGKRDNGEDNDEDNAPIGKRNEPITESLRKNAPLHKSTITALPGTTTKSSATANSSVTKTAGEMANQLRRLGVEVTSKNTTLRQWIADGFTIALLVEAVTVARGRRGKATGKIAANYIDTIVRDPGQKPINGARLHSASEWWETVGGIKDKGKELQIFYDPDPQYSEAENLTIFKATVFVAAGDGPWIDSRDSTMRRIMDQIRHGMAA